MVREPPQPGVGSEVGRARKLACQRVYRRGDASGVEIVDRPVGTDRHAEHGADKFRLPHLVEAGHHPNRSERAIGEIREAGMRDEPGLHDQGIGRRLPGEASEQPFGAGLLTAGPREMTSGDQIPAFGASTAPAFARFHEEIAIWKFQLRGSAAVQADYGLDAGQALFDAMRGEPSLIV